MLGRLDRIPRLFADVQPGEGRGVLLLALDVFLLLTAYYVLKTVREPLILVGGNFHLAGAELRTYASAAQAILLLAIVPLYGCLASKIDRVRLMNNTTGGLVVCLAIFAGLAAMKVPIGLAYYLWLGI